MKLVALIDHYDSFTFNLLDWINSGSAAIKCSLIPYDDPELERRLEEVSGLVLSPGPGNPLEMRLTLQVVSRYLTRLPLFGVCLGHQILGVAAGLSVKRGIEPFHGTRRKVFPDRNSFFFRDFPEFFDAGIYNSLSLVHDSSMPLKPGWRVVAKCNQNEIQAIEKSDKGAPAVGVQYHPESFLSGNQDLLLSKWVQEVISM